MKKLKYILITIIMISVCSLSAQKLDMEKLSGMKARSIGPAGMSGRITAIDVVLSDPSIIYAGSASGGVWKSTSGGINWSPVFDKESTLSIGDVTVQQSNPSVVWVGTGEGNPRNSMNSGRGIYKSLDGGKTWTCMGLEKTRNIHRVIIDPQNPNTVYVGAIGSPWGEHPERGVYKTTDGGKTWTNILYVNAKTGVGDMVMDPGNPNKIIVGMYEHQRRPWAYTGGGTGSGIYITMDGGATWQKRTSKNGLPEGNLGRTGFAIANSKPDVVYAWVESNKNAIYRSDDGGENWNKVNDKANDIGGRPFYYCSIAVDPKNENRLYTYYSEVNVSEDGGKSFRKLLPYSGVHPDHHDWWIHPEDPSYIIDGNDGGLYFTHDYGKNWRFADNIPVGQYYHMNVDMEIPYNVYGGAQDNGVYAGPGYMWKDQGIYNTYWKELMFGDGMDVIPDPVDSRYGYSMTQNGALVRYDKETGHKKVIKPTHPDPKMKLRFNWNSGLAVDPFESSTVYYGSQFLHKSTDKGSTWEVISPDLTSNDPVKLDQEMNGGITRESGSENYANILTIAPSTLEKGLIWVGTDDGHVQLTRDGGKTWANVTPNISGFAKGSWVPQINASTYSPGEVFVVANNYRQFDYKPYIFRSKDYGKTWENMVSEAIVGESNYALALVQDKVEPNLLFVGTENGLFVSIDGGKTYTKWTAGYPNAVPTMDLVIHPREHDLVIGTFGRSFFVLDDIRPLREMAKRGQQLLNSTIKVFSAPDAYLAEYQYADGIMFPAEGMFMGENRPAGATITYAANKPSANKSTVVTPPSTGKKEKNQQVKAEVQPAPAEDKGIKYDSITFEIFNKDGRSVFSKTEKAPSTEGMNRFNWNLTEKSPNPPSRNGGPSTGGFGGADVQVLPGTYKVRITFGGTKDSAELVVKYDPRFSVSQSILAERHQMQMSLYKMKDVTGKGMDRLRESNNLVLEFEKKMKEAKRDDLKDELDQIKVVKDSLKNVIDYIVGEQKPEIQGWRSTRTTISSMINTAINYIGSSKEAVTSTDKRVYDVADDETRIIIKRVNDFYEKTWPSFKTTIDRAGLVQFKSYEPLKLN